MSGGRWPVVGGGGRPVSAKRRLPAYGADALQLRASGMAVRLLVVGLDHFSAGRSWQTIRGSLRVVVPADVRDVAAMDWSVATGLDVLVEHWPQVDPEVAGDAMAQADAMRAALARRDALMVALDAAMAQSLWVSFEDDGLQFAQQVEVTALGAVLGCGDVATVRTMPEALDALHDAQLVSGEGIFGTPEAVPARLARLVEIFGSDERGLSMVASAIGMDKPSPVRAAA